MAFISLQQDSDISQKPFAPDGRLQKTTSKYSTMSRFWAAESSSDDDQGSDSDASSHQAPIVRQSDRKFGSTFEESDSDSEDEVRVVRSEKDRKWDSIREGIAKMRNARRNNDWPLIQDEFGNVNQLIVKSKMLIIQNGIPPFYIKMLVELEDHVQTSLRDKDAIKKMKPAVHKALNLMKLQVRKHNENYKDEIADCRSNPEKYQEVEVKEKDDDDDDEDDDDDDDDDDESSEPVVKAKVTKPTATKKAAVADDSDEDWMLDDDDDDDDEDEEGEDDGRPELKGRARWLKKVVDPAKEKEQKEKLAAKKREAALEKAKSKKEAASASASAAAKRTVSSWEAEDKLTEEELDKRVAELMATRGRKNTDHRDVLRQLEVLTKISRLHGPRKEIPLLMHLISSMLDFHRSIDDYMDHHQWRTCHRSLTRVLALLGSNSSIVLGILGSDEVTDLSSLSTQLKKQQPEEDGAADPRATSSVIRVLGSLESFIIRLQDEYTKSLQQINPHTKEYVVRLSDEASLMELAERILEYYHRVGDVKAAAEVAALIVEHMYYKHNTHALSVRQAHLFNKVWGSRADLHPACLSKSCASSGPTFPSSELIHPGSFKGTPSVPLADAVSPDQKLQQLCDFIFKHGEKRLKSQALLSIVYHHALHDRYYKARDLLLISHIQDFAEKADIPTQILYNRTIATLGLCAFRLGLYQKAHDCLTGICSGRLKELLAQGQMKYQDKDPEQEKIERRRQMPYHMHINPDLLEMCNLTCAMILELPQLARSSLGASNSNPNVISRQFRKFLTAYNKQVFCGPPENTREHVLAATKALLAGEWQRALDYLLNLEVWKLIPNDGAEQAKKILQSRLKEEAIRTFLLLNGEHYDSLNLNYLCDMFDIEEAITRRIISRMIFNREISAAWEQPSNILVIYKTEPSVLQVVSQGMAEKVSVLLESNERILDPLVGVYGFSSRDQPDYSNNNNRNDRDNKGARTGGGGDKKFRNYKGVTGGNKPLIARQPYQKRDGKGKPLTSGGGGGYKSKNSLQSQPKKWGSGMQ